MKVRPVFFVLFIIVFSVALRLIAINKCIIDADEIVSIHYALSDNFINDLRNGWHPPLYFLILRLWGGLSVELVFLRFLSVIFGIGVVVISIKWISRYSRLAGILVGVYFSALPIMVLHSQMVRYYSFLLLSAAFCFYFAFMISVKPVSKLPYLGLMFSLACAVMTHLTGIMLILSGFIYLILIVPRGKLNLRFILMALIIPVFLFIGIYCFFLANISSRVNPGDWSIPAISLQNISTVMHMISGVGYLRAYGWMVSQYVGDYKDLVKFIMLGCSFFVAIRLVMLSDWRRNLPLLIAALVYWAEIIGYSIFFTPICLPRTMLPGMLPFSGFLMATVASLKLRRLKILAIIFILLLCSFFVREWLVTYAHIDAGYWQEMVQVLDESVSSDDVIILYHDIDRVINYFSKVLGRARKVILIEPGMDNFEERIGREIKPHQKGNEDLDVYLFMMPSDKDIKLRVQTHKRLLKYVNDNFGQPSFSKVLGPLKLEKYQFRNENNR